MRGFNIMNPWFRAVDYITRYDTREIGLFMKHEFDPYMTLCGNDVELTTPESRILFLVISFVSLFTLYFHAGFAGFTSMITYSCNIVYSCIVGYVSVNGFWSGTIFWAQFVRRPAFRKTMELVMTNFIRYDVEVDIDDSARRMQLVFQKYFKYFPFVIFVCDAFYIVLKPDMACNRDILQNSIFPAYYPFKLEGFIMFFIANFLQMFYLVAVIYLGCWGFYYFANCCFYWVSQTKRLIESIRTLELRALQRLRRTCPGKVFITPSEETRSFHLYKDKDFIDCYEYCLKENIIHHQRLVRFQYYFQQSVEIPLGTFLALSSTVIAILLLLLFDSFVGSKVVSLCLMSITLVGLYSVSLLGQLFTDLADEVRNAIFETNWPYSNRRIYPLIKIFMEVTKKPMRPCVLGVFHYDMPGFLNILQAAYSYWNFLRLIQALRES